MSRGNIYTSSPFFGLASFRDTFVMLVIAFVRSRAKDRRASPQSAHHRIYARRECALE